MRSIIRLIVAAGIAYCLIAQAIAAPSDLTPISASIAAINSGNMTGMKAQFTNAPTIVDEFAPFLWSGVAAQDRYASDFANVVTAFKMNNITMKLGTPLFNYVHGDRAYVVVPITVTAMLKGKPYSESGINSYVLTRSGGTWRISAQTWTKRSESSNPY
jgi:hypothetical protein